MNRLLVCLSVLGSLAAQLFAAPADDIVWGEPVFGVSLGIFLPTADVDWHKPVRATVLVTNGSPNQVSVPHGPGWGDFTCFATDAVRQPVTQKHKEETFRSGGLELLRSGSVKIYPIDLRNFLVPTNSGEIAITMVGYFRGASLIEVQSGTMVLNITSLPPVLTAEAVNRNTYASRTVSVRSAVPVSTPRRAGEGDTLLKESQDQTVLTDETPFRILENRAPLVGGVETFAKVRPVVLWIAAILVAVAVLVIYRARRRSL